MDRFQNVNKSKAEPMADLDAFTKHYIIEIAIVTYKMIRCRKVKCTVKIQ
jgi:hypothetical protein